MSDVFEWRRENLRRLIKVHGGQKKLSTTLGYANGSYLSQMAGPNPTRAVSEITARTFEETLGLPAGALDAPTAEDLPSGAVAAPVAESLPAVGGFDLTTLPDAIRLVGTIAEENSIVIPTPKFADVLALIYADVQEHGVLRKPFVRQIVMLLK